MKKKKSLICMLAMASLVLPTVANSNLYDFKVYASETVAENIVYVTEGDRGGAGTENDPYRNLGYALEQAPAGAIIKLKSNIVFRFPNNSEYTFSKNVTIDGGSHVLTLSGKTIKLNGDVTFKDMNLIIQRDGTENSAFYVSGYKLEFDNVSTKVSDGQLNERPIIYGGTLNGGQRGSKSTIVVKGNNSESKFDKIYAAGGTYQTGDPNVTLTRSDIPVDILIENPKTDILGEVNLTSVGAAVNVVTKTKLAENFVGDENESVSVTFSTPESIQNREIERIRLTNIKNVTLENSILRVTNNPDYIKNLTLGENSEFILPFNNFAEDPETFMASNITGTGIFELPQNYNLHLPTEFKGTANVRINNNGDLDKDRTYITSENGNINVTYVNEPSNKLQKNGDGTYTPLEKNVLRIENETLPTKVNYKVGETFDTTNMEIKVIYDNGEEVFKDGKNSKIGVFILRDGEYLFLEETLKKGDTVWVFYGDAEEDNDKKYEIPITITEEDSNVVPVVSQVAITKYKGQEISGNSLTFVEDEAFTYEGMEVTLTYNNGQSEVVTAENFATKGITLNIADNHPMTKENNSLTATYTKGDLVKRSDLVAITVNDKVVTGVSITKNPKVEYIEGENFTKDGMEVTLTYNNGQSEVVTANDFATKKITLNVEDNHAMTKSDTSLTATYDKDGTPKVSTPVAITVNDKVVETIAITTNPKVEYIEGENFTKAGMEVTLTYNNGQKEKVTAENFAAKGITLNIADNHPMTKSDTSLTATYDKDGTPKVSTPVSITVNDKVVETIAITTNPKVEYIEGENFTKAGMEVTLTYNNGQSEVVTAENFATKKITLNIADNHAMTKSDTSLTATYDKDGVNKVSTPVSITVNDKVVTPLIEQVVITKYAGKKIENSALTFTEGDTFNYDGMEVALRYTGNKPSERVSSADFVKRGITFNIPNGEVLSKDNKELVASVKDDNNDIDSARIVLTINEKPVVPTENILTINYKYNGNTIKTETVNVEVGKGYTLTNEITVDGVKYIIKGEKNITLDSNKTIDVVVEKENENPISPEKTENTLTINYKHKDKVVYTEEVKVKVGSKHKLKDEIIVDGVKYIVQGNKDITVEQDTTIDVEVKKVVSDLTPIDPIKPIVPIKPDVNVGNVNIGVLPNVNPIEEKEKTIVKNDTHNWVKSDKVWNLKNALNEKVKKAWVKDGKYWFRLNDEGVLLEEQIFELYGNKFHVQKGGYISENAWIRSRNTWYYAKDGGYLATNEWEKVNGKWYWFGKDSKMVESEWFLVNGNWYYAQENGDIVVDGWKMINGKWYHFNKNGEMSVSTYVGKYYVNENGEWVR